MAARPLRGAVPMCASAAMVLLGAAADARGANLLAEGTSFEAGVNGCALGLLSGRPHRECAQVILEVDRATAVDGEYSLKFVRPAACRQRYGLMYRPVALQAGKACVLSAWMKASKEGARGGLSLFAAGGEDPRRTQLRPLTRTYALTTQWARYELRIPGLPRSAPAAPDPSSSLYWAVVHPDDGGATVWIDAVQLEYGDTATPFEPGRKEELAIDSSRPGNQFWAGEAITPRFRFFAAGASGTVVVAYRAVDALGGDLASGSVEAALPPDGHLAANLPPLTTARRAWITIEAIATCEGREARSYLNAAVLERIPPPLPDQPCQFGFNYNAVTSPDDFGADAAWQACNEGLNLDRVFRLAPQAGVRWQRAADVVRWDNRPGLCVEPAPGRFLFRDEGVKAIRAYGLEIMATLGNANARAEFCPPWARSGRMSRLAPIPTDEAWRRYVRAMVQRYKGEISHWEIVNEPNTGFYFEDYVPLLVAAADEIRKSDPHARVIGICATADQQGDPHGFIRSVVTAGGLAHLDVVSGHAFCKPRPWMSRGEMPTWDYFDDLRALLKTHASGRDIPIWNTEGVKYPCWCGRPDAMRTDAEFAFRHRGRNIPTEPALAAAYAVRDSIIEFCGGVRVLFLWNFRNDLANTHWPVVEAFGTVDFFAPDGTPHAKFVALNALAEKLRGARPREHFGLSSQVRCAVFDGAEGAFGVLWRENADENDLRVCALEVPGDWEAQDLFGRPLPSTGGPGALLLKVSASPIYLMGGVATNRVRAEALAAAVREAGRRARFEDDRPLKNALILRRARSPRTERPYDD